MAEIRQGIDDLDQKILDLLSQRIQYIAQAAQIKTSIESIRDEQRIEAILLRLRSQAKASGYSEAFIESIFRQLIEYSIEHEMQLFKQKTAQV